MKSNLDAAQRLFGDDGKPESVALASKEWRISSHDDAEHRAMVADRRRRHIARLEALQRVLGELKTVASAADGTGRMLGVPCLFASSLLHEAEKRERELATLIGMHNRHLAALEARRA